MSGTTANSNTSLSQRGDTPRTRALAMMEKIYRSTNATMPERRAGTMFFSIRSQKSVA